MCVAPGKSASCCSGRCAQDWLLRLFWGVSALGVQGLGIVFSVFGLGGKGLA